MVYYYSKISSGSIGSESKSGQGLQWALVEIDPHANHGVVCSIQWLKFLAWEEFDEEIWGERLRPAYIENSIKFIP